MKSSLFQRTYLITPIYKDEIHEAFVDWSVIEKIIDNRIQPYHEWKNECGHATVTVRKALAFQSTSNQLYIISSSTSNPFLTAMSPFTEPSYESFKSYYKERYGVEINHPNIPLIPARKLVSINREIDRSMQLHISEGIEEESPIYLIPEITMVLPLEFDVFVMHRLLTLFALPMERILQLRAISKRLHEMCSNLISEVPCNELLESPGKTEHLLLRYLEEATSVGSFIAYERLEHLGDAVLGYFVSLNYFACNSTMQWDDEDLVSIQRLLE
jgi:hypothetical protein